MVVIMGELEGNQWICLGGLATEERFTCKRDWHDSSLLGSGRVLLICHSAFRKHEGCCCSEDVPIICRR